MIAVAAMFSALALAAPNASVNRQPTWSPDGTWIAYSSNRGGSFDIWKTDGVHVRRIVRNGADPAWSPRGTAVAFTVGTGGIATVAPGGGRVHTVTRAGSGFEPTWTPSGRSLAFTRPPQSCADGFAVVTIALDGSGEEQRTGSSEFEAYYAPAWSPRGTSIAYEYTNYGSDGAVAQLFLPGDRSRVIRDTRRPGRPSWSPDGRFVVYAESRTSRSDASLFDGFGPMYVVDVKSGRTRRLTGIWGNRPSWSPGGKRIAFAARAADGSTQIFLVDHDGGHLTQLTR